MFIKFLSIFATMFAVSLVVAVFGVLFAGFDGHDVLNSYLNCSLYLVAAYAALSLACLAIWGQDAA
jgi:hypothetical protein